MNITLKNASKADMGKVKTLMLSAFPPEERPPFRVVRSRAKKGKAELLSAYNEVCEFVGFTYIVAKPGLAYIFFLAVEENMRNKGCGRAILEALKEKYSESKLFLAREQLDSTADNYPQRLARHKFYLGCGFEDVKGTIKEANVVYDIMSAGGQRITAKDYDDLIVSWCGRLKQKLIGMELREE